MQLKKRQKLISWPEMAIPRSHVVDSGGGGGGALIADAGDDDDHPHDQVDNDAYIYAYLCMCSCIYMYFLGTQWCNGLSLISDSWIVPDCLPDIGDSQCGCRPLCMSSGANFQRYDDDDDDDYEYELLMKLCLRMSSWSCPCVLSEVQMPSGRRPDLWRIYRTRCHWRRLLLRLASPEHSFLQNRPCQ